MTINILFLTITIKKRRKSKADFEYEQMVEHIYEEHKDRQYRFHRNF